MVRNGLMTSESLSPCWDCVAVNRARQHDGADDLGDGEAAPGVRSSQREVSYASRKDEGMRPRSLTSYPLARAHALIACV
jgi:hypothetical protein